MTELQICPFCSGDAEPYRADSGYWVILCNDCGSEGAPSDHEAGAALYWNRRAAPSQVKGSSAASAEPAECEGCNCAACELRRKHATATQGAPTEPEAGDGGPLREGWHIMIGPGHSGFGAYAVLDEYPEEGSVCLASFDPNDYPDAKAQGAPTPAQPEFTAAARDVLAERRRQVSAEGWTAKHDDEHDNGSMAIAAVCYALVDQHGPRVAEIDLGKLWRWTGWAERWFKPKSARNNLIRAAALLLAEIERMDRAAGIQPTPAQLTPDEVADVVVVLEQNGHGKSGDDYEPECPACTATEKLKAAATPPSPTYEQPLRAVLKAVVEYLIPDGESAEKSMAKIIPIVDPWPDQTIHSADTQGLAAAEEAQGEAK